MSRFPRFFTHRAMLLARNDGLIRALLRKTKDYNSSTSSTGIFLQYSDIASYRTHLRHF